jgi:hypothetical protein
VHVKVRMGDVNVFIRTARNRAHLTCSITVSVQPFLSMLSVP